MTHLGLVLLTVVALGQTTQNPKQPEAEAKSTSKHPILKKGTGLPGSFAPFNLNGSYSGRYHCLVCEYELNPTVLVFARDAQGAKNEQLDALLAGLDKALVRHKDRFLKSFVVFLSPDARNSITDPDKKDAEALIKETEARKAMIERLTAKAKALNGVVVTYFPNKGPDKYQIDPKSDVVVVIYKSYELLADPFIFEAGEMTAKDVDQILKTVDDVVGNAAK